MNPIRRAVDVLSGRADRGIVAALTGQLKVTMDGARLAREMARGDVAPDAAHDRMAEIEHVGDTQRAALVEVLAHSLATPADREDLFRLSRSIDDVLDTLRDFIRESNLYQVSDQKRFVPMLDLVVAGVASLDTAVRGLVRRPARVTESALRARKASGAVRRMYQYEVAELLAEDMTAETFRTRELVRRLEIVGTRLGEAADALADGAMKRWH